MKKIGRSSDKRKLTPYDWRFRWSSRLRRWWYKWSPKNRHSCLKCGFLSFDGKEASADVRRTIAAAGTDGWFIEEDAVSCFKERWYWDGDPAAVAIHEANKPRFNCVGFHRHSPGRSPQDHLKLEDEARDFHRKFILALLTAITALLVAWFGFRHH